MMYLGMALAGLAGLGMLIFGIQILILAFKTSLVWGLASLFIPFVILVFVIKYWDRAKTPFLRSLACFPVYLIGMALIAFGGGTTSMPAQ